MSSVMTQVYVDANAENDDLLCPITLQLIQDPVIASDGRVYERQAITKWILENGTSSFTREPLGTNALQSADHLRHLATQQQEPSVSYHVCNDIVDLPLRQCESRNNNLIASHRFDQVVRNRPLLKCLSSALFLTVFLAGVLFLLVVGFNVAVTKWNRARGTHKLCK